NGALAGVHLFIVALKMEHVDAILLQTILKDLTKFSGSQQQHVNDWLLTINQKFDACELTEPQRRKWTVAFLSDEVPSYCD
ncbi:unnamed protein product, partial [Didymodactylos carnosus]